MGVALLILLAVGLLVLFVNLGIFLAKVFFVGLIAAGVLFVLGAALGWGKARAR